MDNLKKLEELRIQADKLQERIKNSPSAAEIDARIKESFRLAKVKSQIEVNRDKSAKEVNIVKELTWDDVSKMDVKTINENWESIKKLGNRKKS